MTIRSTIQDYRQRPRVRAAAAIVVVLVGVAGVIVSLELAAPGAHRSPCVTALSPFLDCPPPVAP